MKSACAFGMKCTQEHVLSEGHILSARPMARHLVRRMGGARCPESYEELCAVADVALVEAWARYVPGEGARFTTYAFPWVRGALLRHHARRQRHARCEAMRDDASAVSGAQIEVVSTRALLSPLCTEARNLVWSHVVEGRSFAELARESSPSTLRRRYHAALARLRRGSG